MYEDNQPSALLVKLITTPNYFYNYNYKYSNNNNKGFIAASSGAGNLLVTTLIDILHYTVTLLFHCTVEAILFYSILFDSF